MLAQADLLLRRAQNRLTEAHHELEVAELAYNTSGENFAGSFYSGEKYAGYAKLGKRYDIARRERDRYAYEFQQLQWAIRYCSDFEQRVRETAYFISLSPNSGSPIDNWLTAERQLLAD
jgi:hypothetical protein